MKQMLLFAFLFIASVGISRAQQKPAIKPSAATPPPLTSMRKVGPPVVLPDSIVRKYHIFPDKPLPKITVQKYEPIEGVKNSNPKR